MRGNMDDKLGGVDKVVINSVTHGTCSLLACLPTDFDNCYYYSIRRALPSINSTYVDQATQIITGCSLIKM